jgi:DNA (cytosine-5)-methyltransferase 1
VRSQVYYNEYDRAKAAWLRHLIEEGVVAHGVVDERSIEAVQPEDLDGFVQCHFFAGIGLWSLCARRAGWPDDRPVWTGSCPCGPFSIAGKQEGFADPRHLWPQWFRLIRQRRPRVLFGEQSDQAVEWLDLVQGDMEGDGYAIGSAVIPAAGFGGAHERHRIGFVADTDNAQWWTERAPWNDGQWPKTGRVQGHSHLGDGRTGVGMAIAGGACVIGRGQFDGGLPPSSVQPGARERASGLRPPDDRHERVALGDPRFAGLSDAQLGAVRSAWRSEEGRATVEPSDPLWAGVDWLLCRDSRWRPVEPGLSPLVDESPARMGRLRGYGDAIDVEAFTNLIAAYMEVAP